MKCFGTCPLLNSVPPSCSCKSSIGVLGLVIEYITRLDPEVAKELDSEEDLDANQETLFMRRVQQCSRKRDHSDLNLMKKSYTAMNFIVRTDVYNEFILSSGHQTIGTYRSLYCHCAD